MNKLAVHIIFVVIMIAIIVTVDIAFFRHKFWYRLIANVAIVVLAGILYWRFLR